uniref:Helicase/UvrB N-terminal domain-containing protein n=1 Tax=viral metagenome TaxID=1070528 RepID=A0A6C0IK47_9ZZZZ
MDLTQRKLTKAEWTSIEVPVSADETRINELICAGYHNVNLVRNPTLSLLKYMKIAFSEQIDTYLFVHYLQPTLKALNKDIEFPFKEMKSNEQTMKKADLIRLNNTDKQLHDQKDKSFLFEFVLLDLVVKMFDEYAKNNYDAYYTLKVLLTYKVELVNQNLVTAISVILEAISKHIDLAELVYRGQKIIEQNPYLLKYADETLYEHQKQLFTLCKSPQPKLILYIAPTGTGKTLSPLGLADKHRVIFVCAARHVGLALAKAAVSAHKKVAFAFGCNDAEDIRLHYYAAKEYSVNKKSGGIGKVDNSVGDKVEIMISDIQSYLPAMYYMLAFNPKEKIILYWDEPTITLDYKEHEFHKIIQENWTKNIIPNVVLSSATLPQRSELVETINDFSGKFDQADIHEIVSYDCKKTIPLINKEGFTEMPHYLSADYTEIQKIVKHCLIYKTLLRYIDLGEAVKFIKYVTQHDLHIQNKDKEKEKTNRFIVNERLTLALQFPTIDLINMNNLKLYYLNLLGNIQPSHWPAIYAHLLEKRLVKQPSNIHVVTKDAHTLTDGPTIFLADNVDKIAQFYIQSANIPDNIASDIKKAIDFNSALNVKIARATKDFEDGTKKDEGKEKKAGNIDRMDPEMKQKMQEIQKLQAAIKMIVLSPQYIPNTTEHLYKYAPRVYNNVDDLKNKPFTSNVSEDYVEKIMQIDDIEDHWKLLLMMGIGVFTTHKSDRYTELMKSLVQEQKLYLIIASSDFIYGTNYQFCHGYISKDLGHMSQEKCIQSMGRVGRNKLQHDYSIRFRENDLILKLFTKEENKPEVINMNLLFNENTF